MKNHGLNHFGGRRRFHLVGIGGSGMSGLAELLLADGFQVSGSDLRDTAVTRRLRRIGARVFTGHDAEQVSGAEVVVTSSAVSAENPEVSAARRLDIPIVHRARLLAELMRFRTGIAVAGTHGKTTTTAMLAGILDDAGWDPTVYAGAVFPDYGSGAKRGRGDIFLAEADESDRSFLHLHPIHAVVTNIDLDHTDHYRDLKEVVTAFAEFLAGLPFYGRLTACRDDCNLAPLLRNVHLRVLTYGLNPGADYAADHVRVEIPGSVYRLCVQGSPQLEIRLRVAGHHNVLNSLAALATAHGLGVPLEVIQKALGRFAGAERRLELKGERKGVLVLDDYAHHPAEVEASLQACSTYGRRILLVFQPHRFSRTRAFMNEFARAFQTAHRTFLLDIYGAGEVPLEGVTSQRLADRASQLVSCEYHPSMEGLVERLHQCAVPGDLLVTMGAGDVGRIGEMFLEG